MKTVGFTRIRQHKPFLTESLATKQQIPASAECVLEYLKQIDLRYPLTEAELASVRIVPYDTEPDTRCGWAATYLVTYHREIGDLIVPIALIEDPVPGLLQEPSQKEAPAYKDPIEERYGELIRCFGEMNDDDKTILINKLRNAEAGAIATAEAMGYEDGYEMGVVEGKAASELFNKLSQHVGDIYQQTLKELFASHVVDGRIDERVVNAIVVPIVAQAFLLGSSTMFSFEREQLRHIDELKAHVSKFAM